MRNVRQVLGLLAIGLVCSGCQLVKHCTSVGASGVVLDSETHAPLPGASVFVPDYSGHPRVVSTDKQGLFSIAPHYQRDIVFIMGDFMPPSDTLTVKRDGYETATVELWKQHTNFVEVVLSPVTK